MMAKPLVYLFANIPDTTYALPYNHNIDVLSNILAMKKDRPAYKTIVPIYNEKVVAKVYTRIMAIQVMLIQCKLFSLTPEVWLQVHEATSARKAPTKNPN